MTSKSVLFLVSMMSGVSGVARAQGVAAPPAAPAEARAPNVVEAERRFSEAVALMDQRRYEAACPLLKQSHALDPSSGTLLNLGDCYEQRGLTASAYRAFEEARELSVRAGKRERASVAEVRMQKLAKVLRRLSIALPVDPPQNLAIRLDGEPIAVSSQHTELIVDPGVHEVSASAPGYVESRLSVRAPAPGLTTLVNVPALAPLSSVTSSQSDRDAAGSSGFSTRQIAAMVTGSVGVVGVVVGSVFGLGSRSKHEESDRYCTGNVCSEQRGVELMNEARSAGNASTVAFVVGGVALGTAATLWFLELPSDGGTTAQVGVGPAGVQVRGAW
jgi:hypothetical protein